MPAIFPSTALSTTANRLRPTVLRHQCALEWGAVGVGPPYSGGYQIHPGDPIASFVIDPTLNTSDPNNFFISLVGGETLRRENTIRSARLDATYELPGGFIKSIKVGARYSEERSTNGDAFNYEPSPANRQRRALCNGLPMSAPTLSGYNGSANVPLQYTYFNTQSYLNALYGGSYDTWLNARRRKRSSTRATIHGRGEEHRPVRHGAVQIRRALPGTREFWRSLRSHGNKRSQIRR